MKRETKPIVALAAGALFMSGLLGGTVQAQTIFVESGTSYLADVFNSGPTSPETLSVSWFVVENQANSIYTYGYNVFNPAGDVALNMNGTPTTIPESFNSFTLSFSIPTTGYFLATPPAGGGVVNNGANGVTYNFPDVTPGNFSPLLAFQTSVAPGNGTASVSGGAIPPAPWSNVPNNSPVPVPRPVPEPATATLLGLTALGALGRFVCAGRK